MNMLVRTPSNDDRRTRQSVNQKRYRLRRVYGQSVHRVTTNDERVIDLLIAKRYLPDNIIHGRAMIERALSKFIDDEARKIKRY